MRIAISLGSITRRSSQRRRGRSAALLLVGVMTLAAAVAVDMVGPLMIVLFLVLLLWLRDRSPPTSAADVDVLARLSARLNGVPPKLLESVGLPKPDPVRAHENADRFRRHTAAIRQIRSSGSNAD
jgi:hypothetical protein